MNQDDIKALKQELARDLEALERVEAMLARKAGRSITTKDHQASTETQAPPPTKTVARPSGVNTGLQRIVYEIVKANPGIRATEVRDHVVSKGYEFTSPNNAASSVFSALKRLIVSGKITKRNLTYQAVEQRELLHSA